MTFIGSRKVGIDVLRLMGADRYAELDPHRFDGVDPDVIGDIREQEQNEEWGFECWLDDLIGSWDNDKNHILDALAEEKIKRDKAVEHIRLLVAYSREVISGNRPTLASIAEVMGLTISGVRGLYGPDDVLAVRDLLGGIDQRVYQQLVPLRIRVSNVVEYIESLFIMTEEPLDEKSKSILQSAVIIVIMSMEAIHDSETKSLGVWPLDAIEKVLTGDEFHFTVVGLKVPLDGMPESTKRRDADSIAFVQETLRPYYQMDSRKLVQLRTDNFAPVVDRIQSLLKSKKVDVVAKKLRELIDEIVPEQGE